MSLQNRKGNFNRNFGQNNMNANKGQGGTGQRFPTGQVGTATGQRIRLRRHADRELIQQNISRMQDSAHKKRLAQDKYYKNQNQGNRSPLLRTDTYKTNIHSRLGVGGSSANQNLANKPFNAKNKNVRNQGGNRIRLRRQILQPEHIIKNNIARKKNERVKRLQHSAQHRILRIRQNNGNHQNQNNAAQKVRLRRMRPGGPVNYTVQVANNTNNRKQHFKHNVNAALNHKLQEEIRLIQNKNIHHDEIPSVPIHPQGTGFTGTSLNDRFSQL